VIKYIKRAVAMYNVAVILLNLLVCGCDLIGMDFWVDDEVMIDVVDEVVT